MSRISVGGAFAYAALGAAAAAGRELLEDGTYGYWETAANGAKAAREALYWGAGTRTPITSSRGWRLAIRRPPNAEVEDIY